MAEEDSSKVKWRGSPGKRPLFAEVKTSEVDLDDSLPLDVDEELEEQKRPKVMASPIVTRLSVPVRSTTATQQPKSSIKKKVINLFIGDQLSARKVDNSTTSATESSVIEPLAHTKPNRTPRASLIRQSHQVLFASA